MSKRKQMGGAAGAFFDKLPPLPEAITGEKSPKSSKPVAQVKPDANTGQLESVAAPEAAKKPEPAPAAQPPAEKGAEAAQWEVAAHALPPPSAKPVEDLQRLVVDIPRDLHRAIKRASVERGTTIREDVIAALRSVYFGRQE